MTTSPRIAVYGGTFDPLTLGHEDVIRRAAQLFDRLIIAVAVAHHKKTLFSLEERVQQAQLATEGIANIQVLGFDGLLVDFCTHHQACVIVRGLRNGADFDHEVQLATLNRKLRPKLETIFLLPDAAHQCISSSLVREISQLGGDVSALVNPHIARALAARAARS